MGSQGEKSVIHRKAEGARSEFDARVMTPAKALRLALAKTADRLLDMAVTVSTVEQVSMPHGDIMKVAGTDGLLVLLDGAGGLRGAVKLDTQFLTALIEVQTTGKVRQGDAAERRFTRTDAAIAAPLVDKTLQGYDEQLKASEPGYVPLACRYGDMMEDARALSLALEAPRYDLFRLTVNIENGAKTGVLTLMLPERSKRPDPAQAKKPGEAAGFKLEKHALDAPVVMDAVLARVRMPLKQICALAPGMQVPVDAESLARTELVATGGHVVAKVRMGQVNGWRAVRMDPGGSQAAVPAGRAGGTARKAERASLPAAGMDESDLVDGIAEPLPDLPDIPDMPDLPDPDAAGMPDAGNGAGLPMAGGAGAAETPDPGVGEEPQSMAELAMGAGLGIGADQTNQSEDA